MTSPAPIPSGRRITNEELSRSIRELHSCFDSQFGEMRGQISEASDKIQVATTAIEAIRCEAHDRKVANEAAFAALTMGQQQTREDLAGVKGYAQAVAQAQGIKPKDLADGLRITRRAGGMPVWQLVITLIGAGTGFVALLQVLTWLLTGGWPAIEAHLLKF